MFVHLTMYQQNVITNHISDVNVIKKKKKQDLALNNQQWLICANIKTNQNKTKQDSRSHLLGHESSLNGPPTQAEVGDDWSENHLKRFFFKVSLFCSMNIDREKLKRRQREKNLEYNETVGSSSKKGRPTNLHPKIQWPSLIFHIFQWMKCRV